MAQPAPGPALAPDVVIDSAVYVEHLHDATRSLEPAEHLAHGDRVVTLVHWVRLGAIRATRGGGFTVTNAIPASLAWQASAEDDAEVSTDGGRHWGHLGTLRIGARLASAEDVTHARWHVSPAKALSGSGRIAYSGLVR